VQANHSCQGRELKCRDAACRVVSGEQKTYREWPNANGLLGGIDAEVEGLLSHLSLPKVPYSKLRLPLNAAGFDDLRLPHIAVLQFPGPDGVRPGTLAERAGMSKQAINQLLRSLEGLGYIVRSDAPDEGRARIIRFTKRGDAAYSKILDILRNIDREWSAELGLKDFAQLKELLSRVWEGPLTRQSATQSKQRPR
jgi:DNA-binding MarR family transcriptional regulator